MLEGLDADSEADSERDGLLSTRTEYHATAVGAGAGLLGGLFLGTPWESIGLGMMAVVGCAALGMGILSVRPGKAVREVRREPWYALVAMTVLFALAMHL